MSQKNDTLRENLLQYLEAVQEDPENTDWLKELVGWLLHMLELEFTEHLNAGRYERKEERKGYRNGYSTTPPGSCIPEYGG